MHWQDTVLLSIFKNSKVRVDAHEQSDKACTRTETCLEGIVYPTDRWAFSRPFTVKCEGFLPLSRRRAMPRGTQARILNIALIARIANLFILTKRFLLGFSLNATLDFKSLCQRYVDREVP